MADPKPMYQVIATMLGPDGFTPLYHAGELYELGQVPDGVPVRMVVATDALIADAPPHAQQPKKAEAKPAAAESKSGKG